MDSGQLKVALDLFEQLLTQQPERPELWLLEQTNGDREITSYVVEMLNSQHRAQAVLRTAAGASSFFAAPHEWVGETFGRYRITRLIGEGGMSLVFEAERTDGAYQDTVALKLIKDPTIAEGLKRRFELERQVLANLRHPNIATLLDGGQEQGIDYVVLELIDGVSFVEYQRQLSIRESLRLFLDVCRAVQHAHQSLIVHRDIKPGNVLVDEQGVVKLLDFGIAKDLALQSDIETAWTLTPAYASPEQVKGEPITVATDIYSLGVLLYESMAGQRPYDLSQLPPADAVEVVAHEEPQPPSVHAGRLRSLPKHAAQDLDAITGRAMAKDPQRRYPSVSALIEDLEAFLTGRPVTARRGHTGYQLAKFVRRHKAIVTGSAVAALALVVGLIVALTQIRVANEQLARSEAVTRYLSDVLASPDPTWNVAIRGGPDVTIAEVLESAAAQLDGDLTDQPLVRIELYEVMGAAQMWLDNREAALSARERALALRRETFPNDPLNESIGLMRLAEVYDDWGESEVSIPIYLEAVTAYESSRRADRDYGVALLNDTAIALIHARRYSEALDYQKRAVTLARKGVSNEVNLYVSEINLGRAYLEAGHWDQAEAELSGAIQRYRENEALPSYYKVRMMRTRGMLALSQREYAAAASFFHEAHLFAGSDASPHVLASFDLMDTLAWRSFAQLKLGGDARNRAREALLKMGDDIGDAKTDPEAWIYHLLLAVQADIVSDEQAATDHLMTVTSLVRGAMRPLPGTEIAHLEPYLEKYNVPKP